jgi:hypothetical protein
LKINIFADNEVRFIILDIDEKTSINELLKITVDTFNKNFETEGRPYRLSLDYKQYNLKPSKKNGMPKEDLPCNFINISLQ